MEPMNLGSPVHSPGNNQSNQYLPAFLMGDPQAMTPRNNPVSPKQGRYNVSFANSPTLGGGQDFNRSALGSRMLFGSGSGSGGSGTGSGGGNTSLTATPSHMVGPPTTGLFDSLCEITNTPPGVTNTPLQRSQHPLVRGISQRQSPNQSYQQNDSIAVGNGSMRALCSPAAIICTPSGGHSSANFWVTIFGFAPGASSMVLQHFTMCGSIVDVVHATQNGNWMHVRFSSQTEADKALNHNLKVIAGNLMVGVIRCQDGSVVDKENFTEAAHIEASGRRSPGERCGTGPEPSPRSVRPLAQLSFRQAHREDQMSPQRDVPQKSSGLMDRAMGILFGW